MSTVHKHQWHQCCHVHQFLAQLGYCEDEKKNIYIYKPKQVVFWGCFWNEQRAYFKHIVQVNDASTHENHVRHWEEQENWQTSHSKPQPPPPNSTHSSSPVKETKMYKWNRGKDLCVFVLFPNSISFCLSIQIHSLFLLHIIWGPAREAILQDARCGESAWKDTLLKPLSSGLRGSFRTVGTVVLISFVSPPVRPW